MPRYKYTVEIDSHNREHADQVMGERIGYDEDYGFTYFIGYEFDEEVEGGIYTVCTQCHLFVEPNDVDDPDGDIVPFVHLHRGTPEDEALDETHEAQPGETRSLHWWQENGPYAMKARFDLAVSEDQMNQIDKALAAVRSRHS